jgi:hypothetical protein
LLTTISLTHFLTPEKFSSENTKIEMLQKRADYRHNLKIPLTNTAPVCIIGGAQPEKCCF